MTSQSGIELHRMIRETVLWTGILGTGVIFGRMILFYKNYFVR